MLAPPWIPVPPPAYGGTEAVVSVLCDELAARGHNVTLFAAPGLRSAAPVIVPLADPHPDQFGSSLFEADHVAYAYDTVDRLALEGEPFDVVHDHSGFTAVAMADRVSPPAVHTLHAPFDDETRPFYARHGHKAHLVAISRSQLEQAPVGVPVVDVVPNPLRVEDWPLCTDKADYVLWIGRMDPVKGAHRAITAAQRSGHRLVLAGPVQPGQQQYFAGQVEPHIDGEHIVFVGEVGGERRKELFAHAKALLMPIRWAEPFGMVMVEALACGTPVLAFREGAASEIVIHGENGFLVGDEIEMTDAIGELHSLDPRRCRASAAERYDVRIVAAAYEAVYRRAINGEAQRIRAFARRGRLLHRRADATRSMRREGGVTALRALSERGERGGNPMRHSSSLSKG